MTVISEIASNFESWKTAAIVTTVAFALAIICILLAKYSDVFEYLCYVFFAVAIIGLIFTATFAADEKETTYRIRIDGSTTFDEVTEDYDIIKYEEDYDTWVVRKKVAE